MHQNGAELSMIPFYHWMPMLKIILNIYIIFGDLVYIHIQANCQMACNTINALIMLGNISLKLSTKKHMGCVEAYGSEWKCRGVYEGI